MTDRNLTGREAFRAARSFLEQFNQRKQSERIIMLLIGWMAEGTWPDDPGVTADPAQSHDWVSSVDRVIAERTSS